MAERPELILLQKNMALVEGVGRMLDPNMEIWSIAEPIVGNWIKQKAGPKGKLEDVGDQLQQLFSTVGQIPELVERANSLLMAHENEMTRQKKHGGRGFKIVISAIITLLILLLWRVW